MSFECMVFFFFFFDVTATPEIYTLSLHDALPISLTAGFPRFEDVSPLANEQVRCPWQSPPPRRSEEHTSELQSHVNLVCRLLLEKKKIHYIILYTTPLQHQSDPIP